MNGYGEIIDGPVKVSFDYIGEGLSGDFDANDPDDVALLRLDVLVAADAGYDGEETDDPAWLYPQDGSICTQVAEGDDERIRMDVLAYAAAVLRTTVERGESVKHAMDRLSYLPQRVETPAYAGV